jgi:hypothetical protein
MSFKQVLFLTFMWMANFAMAADSYEASTNVLTIPQVKVGDTLYSDVQISVGTIVSVGSNVTADTYDTYNALTNQLSIPVVRVGSATYYDVVITVGPILKVGTSCLINSTCAKVGTPEIKGVLPGDSRISVMFNFMGGKITGQLTNSKFVAASSYTARRLRPSRAATWAAVSINRPSPAPSSRRAAPRPATRR